MSQLKQKLEEEVESNDLETLNDELEPSVSEESEERLTASEASERVYDLVSPPTLTELKRQGKPYTNGIVDSDHYSDKGGIIGMYSGAVGGAAISLTNLPGGLIAMPFVVSGVAAFGYGAGTATGKGIYWGREIAGRVSGKAAGLAVGARNTVLEDEDSELITTALETKEKIQASVEQSYSNVIDELETLTQILTEKQHYDVRPENLPEVFGEFENRGEIEYLESELSDTIDKTDFEDHYRQILNDPDTLIRSSFIDIERSRKRDKLVYHGKVDLSYELDGENYRTGKPVIEFKAQTDTDTEIPGLRLRQSGQNRQWAKIGILKNK